MGNLSVKTDLPKATRLICRVPLGRLCRNKYLQAAVGIGINLSTLLVHEHYTEAAPARFWLSTSDDSPSGLEAPTVFTAQGLTHQVHIWGQPETVDDRPEVPWGNNNPFKKFESFTLNLVSTSSLVDFLDNSIVVHNPGRFQYLTDSTSDPPITPTLTAEDVEGGAIDEIRSMAGVRVDQAGSIGPTCSDSLCFTNLVYGPAWLIATVEFQTINDSGNTEFFLQIGSSGMNHLGEEVGETSVTFGTDTGVIYYAGEPNHRDNNIVGDTPDMVVEIAAGLPGDFNNNGTADAADYVIWRENEGTTNLLPNDPIGGTIGAAQYNQWRANFGNTAASSSASFTMVPEPATAVFLTLVSVGVFIRRIMAR
jgi:hypothetical protein